MIECTCIPTTEQLEYDGNQVHNVSRTIHLLACNFAKIMFTVYNIFTSRLVFPPAVRQLNRPKRTI